MAERKVVEQVAAEETTSDRRYRIYGVAPYTVIVVHGGPGALGSLAPVARELAPQYGVLETLHTALSVDGQLDELRAAITSVAQPPVALIGHSWGAMLGVLFAARYPALVGKLILIGSGVYEDSYAQGIDSTRLQRLSAVDRAEIQRLAAALDEPNIRDADAVFARLGALFAKADTYNPLPGEPEQDALSPQKDVFEAVWPEAAALRRRGIFLEAADQLQCPVVAIHGEYDSHPVAGIQEPLARTVKDFRLIVLAHCGHEPWIEREARDTFYRVLREELAQ
ncbi:MAG: alpha/beta hydrolase [Ktedonobacterales bacterium]